MSAVQRVLMVCTANICRSPTAEAVLRHRVQQAGLHGRIVVDSAGTRASHELSHAPDPRSIAHAARRGYDLTGLRSRPVVLADFHRFDLIVPMDRTHLDHLAVHAPADAPAKVRLLMSFAPPGAGDVAAREHGARAAPVRCPRFRRVALTFASMGGPTARRVAGFVSR